MLRSAAMCDDENSAILNTHSLEDYSNELGQELINLLLQKGEIVEKINHQTSVDGTKYRVKNDIKSDRYDEFIAAFNGILEEVLRQGNLLKQYHLTESDGPKLNLINGESKESLDAYGRSISKNASTSQKSSKCAKKTTLPESLDRCLNPGEDELLQRVKLLNKQLSTFIRSIKNEPNKSKSNKCGCKNSLNNDIDSTPRRYFRKPRADENPTSHQPSLILPIDGNQEKERNETSQNASTHSSTENPEGDTIQEGQLKENLHMLNTDGSHISSIGKRHTPDELPLNKENNYGVESPKFANLEEENDEDDCESTELESTTIRSQPTPTNAANAHQRRQPPFTIANNGISIPLRLVKGPGSSVQLVLDRRNLCHRCKRPKQ